jgi:precorrin-6Y C5,15-methyltransferase (decarboxylating)
MSRPVFVLGLGAEGPSGLPAHARTALASATFLAGGTRHLALVEPFGVETFAIKNNLDDLIERLRRRGPEERCVVLASGDPLFYGIGHTLGHALGRDQIRVEPALSSLQMAFARAGVSWHDAVIGTIHGRPLLEALLPLLGRPKIGLFTQDGGSPSAVAAFFLERGLKDYRAFVGENLGAAGDRFTEAPLLDLLDRRFDDLNVLILIREPPIDAIALARTRSLPCPPDSHFARPEYAPVLLTHADVRSMVLARFWGLPEGPIWDIGAGLGGVSVGLARSFPDREIVAVERSSAQRSYLETNRLRFEAYNLRILAGSAPGSLEEEVRPAGIFLGGTGGALDAILDLALDRLRPSGILVANFVGLENLGRALDRLRGAGWTPEVSQASISHGQALAGLTVLSPERPVWIVRAVRSGSEIGEKRF